MLRLALALLLAGDTAGDPIDAAADAAVRGVVNSIDEAVALNAKSNDPRVFFIRAGIELQAGNLDRAREEVARLAKLSPEAPETLTLEALVNVRAAKPQQRWTDAFAQALHTAPLDCPSWFAKLYTTVVGDTSDFASKRLLKRVPSMSSVLGDLALPTLPSPDGFLVWDAAKELHALRAFRERVAHRPPPEDPTRDQRSDAVLRRAVELAKQATSLGAGQAEPFGAEVVAARLLCQHEQTRTAGVALLKRLAALHPSDLGLCVDAVALSPDRYSEADVASLEQLAQVTHVETSDAAVFADARRAYAAVDSSGASEAAFALAAPPDARLDARLFPATAPPERQARVSMALVRIAEAFERQPTLHDLETADRLLGDAQRLHDSAAVQAPIARLRASDLPLLRRRFRLFAFAEEFPIASLRAALDEDRISRELELLRAMPDVEAACPR